jgi:hypothetical protein
MESKLSKFIAIVYKPEKGKDFMHEENRVEGEIKLFTDIKSATTFIEDHEYGKEEDNNFFSPWNFVE